MLVFPLWYGILCTLNKKNIKEVFLHEENLTLKETVNIRRNRKQRKWQIMAVIFAYTITSADMSNNYNDESRGIKSKVHLKHHNNGVNKSSKFPELCGMRVMT